MMFENNEISDDDEEIIMNLERRRKPKVIKERPDYFNILDDVEFYRRFRLSKRSVQELHDVIHEEIESPTQRNQSITPMVKILLTLRYYALGTILLDVGDFAGVSKTSAHSIVWQTTRAIASLRGRFVKLPSSREEILEVRRGFYGIARFPRVIGALDCTHVKIQSPGGGDAETFRNRKGWFSFNVQAVVGPTLKIFDIIARWPGSVHDQTIFNNSRIQYRFEDGEMGDSLLLGDSGYACRPYLITPLQQPHTRAENLFNECQIRTRNVVERCFGVWKRRFPVLRRGLCMSNEGIQAVIVATAVLHNLACEMNDAPPPEDPDIPLVDEREDVEELGLNPVNDPRNDMICRQFNVMGKQLLNKGFVSAERYHSHCIKAIKSQLPRRESERRSHPMARHCDILTAIETRLSMLSMTFMKYVDVGLCCFIPGKVVDEIFRVLRFIKDSKTPPRAHEILQELRDISSMAMEHFDEKIVPVLKQSLVSSQVHSSYSLSGSSLMAGMSSPAVFTQEKVRLAFHKLHCRTKCNKSQVHKLSLKVARQNTQLRLQARKLRAQAGQISEIKRHLEEWDHKFGDLIAELSRAREDTAIAETSQNIEHSATRGGKRRSSSTLAGEEGKQAKKIRIADPDDIKD